MIKCVMLISLLYWWGSTRQHGTLHALTSLDTHTGPGFSVMKPVTKSNICHRELRSTWDITACFLPETVSNGLIGQLALSVTFMSFFISGNLDGLFRPPGWERRSDGIAGTVTKKISLIKSLNIQFFLR